MFLDSTTTYTVTFDFLNGVPSPLVLVMSGLLDGSRIVKKVEGAPAGFGGTFTGTLRCWINGTNTPFPVSINYPTPGSQTITNLPLGSSCTFEETGRAPLPAPYQWLPPVYSREFGQILLAGACNHELVVTNRANSAAPMPGSRASRTSSSIVS